MTKGCVFLVEGDSDLRFVENILLPQLSLPDNTSITYSEEPDPQVNDLISAFQGMYRELYLLRDFDYGKQDCYSINERKSFVETKFGNISPSQIIVVSDAIEGWYLAGLDKDAASELGFSVPSNTGGLGKDDFNSKLDKSHFSSSINLQLEIIELYSIDIAKQKNSSFKYMAEVIGI